MSEIKLDAVQMPDVNEDYILFADEKLLEILLKDRTTGQNILWMTDNYVSLGSGYEETSSIAISLITGKQSAVIKPRIEKTKEEQIHRVRDKAEVFTPSWICNKQNNLIDEAWFGCTEVFNKENGTKWETTKNKISFTEGKTWQDYILAQRLEISCGEAPYLVSRYDTTTGVMIPVPERIGLLDRKLRVVAENTTTDDEWLLWAIKAVQNVYGYEWQGDNLLLARENVLLTFIDYYKEKFSTAPKAELLLQIADIISWNLWQMDGIKFVVPLSCHENIIFENNLFETVESRTQCEGCEKDDINKHNGIKCKIKDWQENKVVTAVSLLKGNG